MCMSSEWVLRPPAYILCLCVLVFLPSSWVCSCGKKRLNRIIFSRLRFFVVVVRVAWVTSQMIRPSVFYFEVQTFVFFIAICSCYFKNIVLPPFSPPTLFSLLVSAINEYS
ncbi:unnamed protein product [Ectocarpus sp. 6 AP-2014]